MKSYKIAVIPGDGIGKEVVPEGIRVLEAVGRKFDLNFTWQEYDWSCETFFNLNQNTRCLELLASAPKKNKCFCKNGTKRQK